MSDAEPREVVSDPLVAAAVWDAFPPYDPDDITTWSAEQLDDLADFLIEADPDARFVDEPPVPFDAEHGVNTEGEMLYTADRPAPGEWDPEPPTGGIG